MKSSCVIVAGKKVSFQTMGKGPALVLLHPSPHNSNMMLPLAKELASDYTVLCMDTPGYGNSDGLDIPPYDLTAYTLIMKRAFKRIGLKKFSLYGSATGAQLAIRYALENPEEVAHIFLDNAAHFDDDLRNEILAHYFPDLTPKEDGGHLIQLWTIVSQLFLYFPWCFTTLEYALNRQQVPKKVLHFVALDFLRAGANYDWAYKAAFEHERARYVQQLKVPATIVRWNGSIIAKYIDRLLSFDLPDNVSVCRIDGTPEERTNIMTKFMKEKAKGQLPIFRLNGLEACLEMKTVAYETVGLQRPELTSNGVYLSNAWDILKKNNAKLSPAELQEALIDWYSV